MKQSRLGRLIILLRLLQAGRSYHTQSLATECGVSQRTIFRDLNLLKEAGIPLIFDEARQGYAVYGARLLPATHFTTDEVLAILFLGREFVAQLPSPCFSAAHRAILKLEGALPLRLVEQVRATGNLLHVSSMKTNPLKHAEPIYEAILQAQLERHVIWMDYRSLFEQTKIQTRFHPYCLFFGPHAWYVVGWSSFHREVRTFHLGRIENIRLLDETFRMPSRFSLKEFLGNAWSMMRCGDDQEVLLRFSSKVAQNVAEVQWHPTQQVWQRPDGRLDFQVIVAGLDEILWWILGYGSEVQVLAPETLRQKVLWHAKKMLDLYENR